jgi:uncharacterized protein
MLKRISRVILFLIISMFHLNAQNSQDSLWMMQHYSKQETMIRMRDGVSLFTAIYIPKDKSKKHPFLMNRTPYSCAPYGTDKYRDFYNSYHKYYLRAGYIMVFQDVRGRFMSEGSYEDIRPHLADKKSKNDVDESTDTYDTVEWLINNIENNNGNVVGYLEFLILDFMQPWQHCPDIRQSRR